MKLDTRFIYLFVIPLAILSYLNFKVTLEYIYAMLFVLLIAGFTHAVRKILVRRVDMGVTADKANESSSGAGMVFLGMSIMISAFSLVLALLMNLGH